MFDIICIGNLNFDIILNSVSLPDSHEKINCEQAYTALGGAAGNTASRLASLGHKVGFVGCVGNDPMGLQHIAEFKKLEVDTSEIKTVNKNTGLAIIFSSRNDKRMIKIPGANAELQISENYLLRAKHIHLSSNKKEIVKRVIKICKDNQIPLSYDPGENKYLDLIDQVDYLILNEDEAKRLIKSDSIETAISKLYAKNVVITKNLGGCLIKDCSATVSIDSFGVKAIDTTGAGDAFDAGFIHGIITNQSLKRCGLLGVAAASLKVQHYGARSGNISYNAMEELLN